MFNKPLAEISGVQKTAVIAVAVILLLGSIVIAGIFLGLWDFNSSDDYSDVTSYEDCILVDGAIIQESYPEVCVLLDGSSFVHEIEGLDSEIGE